MTEEIVPFQLVTLENDENVMPLVEAELNGFPIRLVVDTGASHTCLDKSAVRRCIPSALQRKRFSVREEDSAAADTVMGLGGRRLSHVLCMVNGLKIGNLVVSDYRVVAVRLTNINKMLRFIGQEPIDGLMGCDLLSQYHARIDFGTMTISFCR